MCGIAGSVEPYSGGVNEHVLREMTSTVRHRGPDDSGFYFDPLRQVGLGHQRLKIIDLSDAANQPMSNEDGTVWITYNGEIYNYQDLDSILKSKGHRYRSQCDTETIVHAYEEWGEDCVTRLNGMFAFALWDERKKQLFCARDRFGEKPFYYFSDGGRFVFGSEIKSLLQDPGVPRRPNYFSLRRYLLNGLIDVDEATMFEGIQSLPPAHTLMVRDGRVTVRRYWSLPCIPDTNGHKSEADWTNEVLALFEDAVKRRLRSDVPIGTCLSGGLDSSTIICLMEGLIDGPVAAFSVAYDDEDFSEHRFIKAITDNVPLDAHVVMPTGDDLYDTLERIVWHNDEPSHSTGQYSQWHVMKLAAEHGVTVILNGQGGDELLAGYHRYIPTYIRELLLSGNLTQAAREMAGDMRLHGRGFGLDLRQVVFPALPGSVRKGYTRWLSRGSYGSEFLSSELLAEAEKSEGAGTQLDGFRSLRDHLAHDLTIASVPSLVHSEDRCSMAFSREIRLPFLDHRLVELAFGMPSSMKIRSGATKHVLRRIMAKQDLPTAVVNRHDKKGYPTPIGKWFRTIAREQTRELIESRSFRERGLVKPEQAEAVFKLHCSQKADFTTELYRWVNLELWHRRFLD